MAPGMCPCLYSLPIRESTRRNLSLLSSIFLSCSLVMTVTSFGIGGAPWPPAALASVTITATTVPTARVALCHRFIALSFGVLAARDPVGPRLRSRPGQGRAKHGPCHVGIGAKLNSRKELARLIPNETQCRGKTLATMTRSVQGRRSRGPATGPVWSPAMVGGPISATGNPSLAHSDNRLTERLLSHPPARSSGYRGARAPRHACRSESAHPAR